MVKVFYCLAKKGWIVLKWLCSCAAHELWNFLFLSYGDTAFIMRLVWWCISFNFYNRCVDKLTYLAFVTDHDLERLVKETEGKIQRCIWFFTFTCSMRLFYWLDSGTFGRFSLSQPQGCALDSYCHLEKTGPLVNYFVQMHRLFWKWFTSIVWRSCDDADQRTWCKHPHC